MFTLVAAKSEEKSQEESGGTAENPQNEQGESSVPIVAKPDGAQPVDLTSIKQVAQSNPQAVASVIKGWVEGDGNE
jgi:flagellar biosynthesis/type III secretory pathway M-ring protein FliF/YscJ